MNYLNEVVNLMPRVLSLLDRNSFSPTYGCFDRDYWHYKIIKDYPSSIFQQGILSLALLYKNDFSGNIYYKNENILEWIKAGLLFWSKIQNMDGSFNEWFPNEHSHVATAFTSYAVSETILLLESELSPDIKQKLIDRLLLSGKWLSKNNDRLVINHTAGSVAALYNIYLLTGDKYFHKAVEEDIDVIAKGQDEEGWFSEYGGADIGYLSVSIDYLAKYFRKSRDLRVKMMLEKALNFLVCFIHPDGTSGGVYGSRNTQYIMPHGLVILAPYFSNARYILKSIWPRLGEQINMFDDRYFIFFMFPNFIQAGLEVKEDMLEYSDSIFTNYRKIFNNAGLISIKNSRYHLICNFKKGGVFNIFSHDRLILSDSGYFCIDSKGRIFTSQWFERNRRNNGASDNTGLIVDVDCPFVLVDSKTMVFVNLFLLRLFNLTLCRFGRFAQVLNRHIKRKKIIKHKMVPVFLKRKIYIEDAEILVEDEVDATMAKIKFDKFKLGGDETVMHVPSSRYFNRGFLDVFVQRLDIAGDLNLKGKVRVVQKIKFTDNSREPEISVEKA